MTPSMQIPQSMADAVMQQLDAGIFDQQAVTQRLSISVRTLQRRLAADGTSFKMLLREARRQKAACYLSEGRHTVKEVAYLLGFQDLSNFARTCRDWFGVPATQLLNPDNHS
jgi:AraC-like DNA-binding protein